MIVMFFFFFGDNEEESILDFLAKIPGEIDLLINPSRSNLLIEADKRQSPQFPSYSNLVYDANKETFEAHNKILDDFKSRMGTEFLRDGLRSIGMTQQSLRLKSQRLRDLYDRLYNQANSFIDIMNGKTRKLCSLFLEQLTSLLSSLSKLFPVIEKIIELVEVLKNILDGLEIE